MDRDRFGGFPARMDFTAVPTVFLTRLMSGIEDINELKITLHVIQLLYHKKGHPRFVSYSELAGDGDLLAGLAMKDKTSGDALRRALDMAIDRGTIVNVRVEKNGRADEFFLLNSEAGHKGIESILRGELAIRNITAAAAGTEEPPAPPRNIFALYEGNIGVITPMIAEELRSAEQAYPADWIEDAFREAAALNRRNWRYIARILENWMTRGRDNGEARRPAQTEDPEKYIKGRFGHLVKR